MDTLVARADELSQLHDALTSVSSGPAGRFVLITGEAGSGKTALCTEFSRHVADAGMPIAFSRCWDGGDGPPLWPWPDVIRRLAGRDRAALPVDLVGHDRFGMFEAITDRLEDLCVQRPGVVVIDDLHDTSPDVLLLSRFVARALHRFPLLMVATWRIGHPALASTDDRLDSLRREATVLDLPPFGEAEISEYLRTCGHSASPAEVGALLAVTAGNPLYLAEAVRRKSVAPWSGSADLAQAVARRLGELDETQRSIVGAAAVLAEHATVCSVAASLDLSPTDVIAAVEHVGDWVSISAHRLAFSHDLIRDAFTEAMTASERQRLHAAALSQIGGSDVDQVVRRAHHAREAAGLSRAHALAAVDAARSAATALYSASTFEQAAEWAARGCELSIDIAPPAVEAELWLARADAVLACGRLTEARQLYERAVRPATIAADDRLLARAAIGLGGVWVEEQRDDIARRRMLALCRGVHGRLTTDDSLLAARLAVRIAAEDLYQCGRTDEISAAVDEVRRHGDPRATAEALSLYHHTLLEPDRAADRLRIADELVEVADEPDAAMYSLFGLCWRTVDLYLLGDHRAEASFIELRERTTALGNQSIGYIASVLDVMRAFRRGDLDDTELRAADALTLGTSAGDADALSWYGGHLLAVRWAQGRLSEMRDMVTTVIESSTLRRLDLVYPALLAYTAALQGDVGASHAAIDAVLADEASTLANFSTWTTTMMVLAETAAELGDAGLADAVAERFAPYAHLPVMPSLAVVCLGPGERVMATAHMAAGRLDDAVTWFRAALTANDRLGNRPFHALILAQLAAALTRRRRPEDVAEAADLYAAAITLGDEMGMAARVAEWTRSAADVGAPSPPAVESARGMFEQHGDSWRVSIGGRSTTIRHTIGMRYIAELIDRPGAPITAQFLSAAVTGLADVSELPGDATIDARARRQYQRRIRQLDCELETADVVGDEARSTRAAAERDEIIQHLRREVGLGGRSRRISDHAERARMRVSKAIQRAIRQIANADPALGRALQTRIHTGVRCQYLPDPGQPIEWTVRIEHPAA